MKRALGLLITIVGAGGAVYFQKMSPSLGQWVLVYMWIFFAAWFGGLVEGIVATVVGLGLSGFILIPRESFGPLDAFTVILLMFLGSWVSYSMDRYKLGRLKARLHLEMEKAKTFLDTLLDNIPLMVYVKDAEDLRIRNFNEFGLKLLNLRREDVIGKSDFDICSEEEAKAFQKTDREVLSRGVVVDIPVEEILVPGKGKLLVHTRKIPIMDGTGKPLYLLGVSEDVTEKVAREKKHALELQKEAARRERQKIRERENVLAQAISSLSGTIDYHEATENLTRAVVPGFGDWAVLSLLNEDGVLLRTAGSHRDPALKGLMDEFIRNFPPTDEDVELQRALRQGIPTLEKGISEEELAALTRSPRKLELYEKLGTFSSIIVPVRTGQGILGVLGISRGKYRDPFDDLDFNIAQEIGLRAGTILENTKLFQSTQKAVRARDEFLSIASHELKTPITSLRLQLEMMLRPGRSPELSRPLQNAVKQVDRLTLLVNDLLDVGRLESGKMNYHLDVVGIGDVVKDVSSTMLPHFLATGTVLNTEIDGNPYAFVDRYRMEQVLVNLLNNALKYGPGKPVQLSVKRTGADIVLKIRDKGVGIAPDQIHKIFEKFERGGKVSSVAGLGLGLYITREIIQAFRGSIDVKSVEGQWTEFTVVLPGA